MRLTIERMRTLVLAAGVLLLLALVVFLAVAKLRNPFNKHDLPKKLGMEIQQESDGVTYTHEQHGRTIYKIHASRVVQLKQGDAQLHDVRIELFGADGNRVDRIEGAEFDYDQKSEVVRAAGAVEITLMKPGEAPVIAPNATPEKALGAAVKDKPLAEAAHTVSSGQIHIKTSGLIFDRSSGVATTKEAVRFEVKEGEGSAVGAEFTSDPGHLVLDRDVQLHMHRGDQSVTLRAQHAEFDRETNICRIRAAEATMERGAMAAGEATLQFRDDGSIENFHGEREVRLSAASGGEIAAPRGSLEFDALNKPRYGRMDGGVTLRFEGPGRSMHGGAPWAEVEFDKKGFLTHAHLERDVQLHSDEESVAKGNQPVARANREWRSPLADLEFRNDGKGRTELARLVGTGGVTLTSETRRGTQPPTTARLTADTLTGDMGAEATLEVLHGVGHAGLEQTKADGSRQTSSGDRMEVHFASAARHEEDATQDVARIQSAIVEGHLVMLQTAADSKRNSGSQLAASRNGSGATLRATAARAVYEGAGEWLHLTGDPRIENGGLRLSADKIDVSQQTGDALAHGNVKASWTADSLAQGKAPAKTANAGEESPMHVVAAEAVMRRDPDEATFRGAARMWQQANAISAPVITLDASKRMLTAVSTNAAEPVRAVMVGVENKEKKSKPAVPSVVRLRGGEMRYVESDTERRAWMRPGSLGSVVAETGMATSSSREVELTLRPAEEHASANGPAWQVETVIARGHVVVSSEGRRGTGEQLVYTGRKSEYRLTGTPGAPPRIEDGQRGSITGETLIFGGNDKSVVVEGGPGKTSAESHLAR